MSSRVTPKRRIERVGGILSGTIPSTAGVVTLHTAEDAKTLVRVLLMYKGVTSSDDPGGAAFTAILGVSPGGTTVITPTVSQTLDQDITLQEIARFRNNIYRELNASSELLFQEFPEWHLDTKAMRKLKAGDKIEINHIAGSAKAYVGYYYLWFKE